MYCYLHLSGKIGSEELIAQQVGDFGYSMYVKDTEGSVMCLWEEIG